MDPGKPCSVVDASKNHLGKHHINLLLIKYRIDHLL